MAAPEVTQQTPPAPADGATSAEQVKAATATYYAAITAANDAYTAAIAPAVDALQAARTKLEADYRNALQAAGWQA